MHQHGHGRCGKEILASVLHVVSTQQSHSFRRWHIEWEGKTNFSRGIGEKHGFNSVARLPATVSPTWLRYHLGRKCLGKTVSKLFKTVTGMLGMSALPCPSGNVLEGHTSQCDIGLRIIFDPSIHSSPVESPTFDFLALNWYQYYLSYILCDTIIGSTSSCLLYKLYLSSLFKRALDLSSYVPEV